jgi:hypothetical protein
MKSSCYCAYSCTRLMLAGNDVFVAKVKPCTALSLQCMALQCGGRDLALRENVAPGSILPHSAQPPANPALPPFLPHQPLQRPGLVR